MYMYEKYRHFCSSVTQTGTPWLCSVMHANASRRCTQATTPQPCMALETALEMALRVRCRRRRRRRRRLRLSRRRRRRRRLSRLRNP